MSQVYLIHFERPYKHAQHYLGWAKDLGHRIEQHRTGRGSRLMQVVTEAGIVWSVVKTWTGGRKLERELKRQKHGPRLCPVCNKKGA